MVHPEQPGKEAGGEPQSAKETSRLSKGTYRILPRVAGKEMSWKNRVFWTDSDATISELEDKAEALTLASFSARAK